MKTLHGRAAFSAIIGLLLLSHTSAQDQAAKPAGTVGLDANGAASLVALIKRTTREPETPARNARLARLAGDLDRLPDTYLDQKVEGHFFLKTVDATVRHHAGWLIESAKTWPPALRKKYGVRLPDAYAELASDLAADGLNDEALAVIRRVPVDLADVPGASRAVGTLRSRLELIGTAAAPLQAPRWLSLPAGSTTLSFQGKVTLIEFSAHWCAPCTESYPALNRFRKAYGARGFQVAIATELYGYFGKDKPLAPEAELARDTAYYSRHLPAVPVAIGNQVTVSVDGETTTYSPARDPNHRNYQVAGLPQFYLVDRHGVIRYVMSGYGRSSEARLAKRIRTLLDER